MAAEFVDDLRLATYAEMSRSEDIAWTGREKESLLMQLFVTRDRWTSVAIKLCGVAGGGGKGGGGECDGGVGYHSYFRFKLQR